MTFAAIMNMNKHFMVLSEKFHFPKKPKVVLHHESGKVSCHDELFSSSLN